MKESRVSKVIENAIAVHLTSDPGFALLLPSSAAVIRCRGNLCDRKGKYTGEKTGKKDE